MTAAFAADLYPVNAARAQPYRTPDLYPVKTGMLSADLYPVKMECPAVVADGSLPGKDGSRAAVPDAGSLPGKDRAARLSLRTDLYPVKMELPDRGAGESLSVWMGALIAVGVRGDCASTASCRSTVIP